jgi:hypothetical protein
MMDSSREALKPDERGLGGAPRNCHSQRPVDALILMAWCGCLCADRLLGVRLLGQVQINLLPQLIGKKADHWDELFCSPSLVLRVVAAPSMSPLIPATARRISAHGKSASVNRSPQTPGSRATRKQSQGKDLPTIYSETPRKRMASAASAN